MRKISRADMDRLASFGEEINSVLSEIEALRETTEAEFARLLTELQGPQEEARGILEDAASEAEQYFDDRSEKWQEGDAGSVYSEWRDRLRGMADSIGEDIEAPEIGDLERPDWVDELINGDFGELEN